jgi:molybdopterin-binding protein
MPRQSYAVGEAARLLGVSVDTLRRWDQQGRIKTHRDSANRRRVPAAEVERLRGAASSRRLSARNRLTGTVQSIEVDGLLAQVELAAGPFRVLAVITREAAEALGLEPGMSATAVVKATSVLIER